MHTTESRALASPRLSVEGAGSRGAPRGATTLLVRKRRASKGSLVREGIELLFAHGPTKDSEPLSKLIGQAAPSGIRDGWVKHDGHSVAVESLRNR